MSMTIKLNPEDELIVQECLKTGAYASPEELVHQALRLIEADEAWLLENKNEIHDQIGVGIAELDRGEGLNPQEARSELQRKKDVWLRQQS